MKSCINDEVKYNIPSTVIFFLGILHTCLLAYLITSTTTTITAIMTNTASTPPIMLPIEVSSWDSLGAKSVLKNILQYKSTPVKLQVLQIRALVLMNSWSLTHTEVPDKLWLTSPFTQPCFFVTWQLIPACSTLCRAILPKCKIITGCQSDKSTLERYLTRK